MNDQVSRRIFLTGFSGSGKSTVAQALASRLGWTAYDTDRLIEEREGRTIAAIFDSDGERYFRTLETKALQDVCTRDQIIVACGGGVPVLPENRRTSPTRPATIWHGSRGQESTRGTQASSV